MSDPGRLRSEGVGSGLLKRLLAPAVWLERARGWRRAALAVVYLVVLVAIASGLWWLNSLNGLPDVGDPFDVEAVRAIDVPEAENAFLEYTAASRRLEPMTPEAGDAYNAVSQTIGGIDWAAVDPPLRQWLLANRDALALWRQGTEKPDALLVPPDELDFSTTLEPAQKLRDFARLAVLEAARQEAEGDMRAAWAWYRAVLRSSRHAARHGPVIQRLIGSGILSITTPEVSAWASDDRTDSALLRQALEDLEPIRAMTPPNSEALKLEYLMMMRALRDPEGEQWAIDAIAPDPEETWFYHLPGSRTAIFLARREPERSRRVARLFFANWLTVCDEPIEHRPPLMPVSDIGLYQIAPDDPRALSPQALERWYSSSIYARAFMPAMSNVMSGLYRDRAQLDNLTILLAEELYRREHGRFPPSYETLLDEGYLDTLPELYRDLAPIPSNKPSIK